MLDAAKCAASTTQIVTKFKEILQMRQTRAKHALICHVCGMSPCSKTFQVFGSMILLPTGHVLSTGQPKGGMGIEGMGGACGGGVRVV